MPFSLVTVFLVAALCAAILAAPAVCAVLLAVAIVAEAAVIWMSGQLNGPR